ncbi:alpha/beta hydrolase [Corynebacterium nuruki]|jgi:S-formylglutathione hydrolase FrmB|uniref:alpha/beta hydrolase n=1 Tax=Corynebacterium nuruki TaxID=1032851 RepID=UPI000248560F|nr:alpha/beta hydrolase family protein [Corynebacterium nuruki]
MAAALTVHPALAAADDLPTDSGNAGSAGSAGSSGGDASLSDQIAGSSIHPDQSSVPQDPPAVPDGVRITRVDDLDGDPQGRVKSVHITSPAMKFDDMVVEMILAKDWYTHPDESFPSLWGLNGLYGSEEHSAWLPKDRGDALTHYADKNINVVLPVGGYASFYTDWEKPDLGAQLNWETFLTKELPGLLARDMRSNNHRGIMGVSMGATASMLLAERHPDLFQFAGSMSGFLDTTSPGMPEAIGTEMQTYGRTATNMWGPYYSQGWRDHDPKLMIGNLRNTAVFVSAGTGVPYPGEGYGDPSIDQINQATEAVARLNAQTFLTQAAFAGVKVQSNLRPAGSHNWMSWQKDLETAWPLIASSLGIEE